VIGVVGILDDVTKAVPADFQREGDHIVLLMGAVSIAEKKYDEVAIELGCTEFAKDVMNGFWGRPPVLDLRNEAALHRVLKRCADEGILHSAADISDGGIAVTLSRSAVHSGIGATLLPSHLNDGLRINLDLFGETATGVVVTCRAEDFERVDKIAEEAGSIFASHIGSTGGRRLTMPFADCALDASIEELRVEFATALETNLHDQTANEVLA
jgi:phosphoribosylformylglycinamidine synthase